MSAKREADASTWLGYTLGDLEGLRFGEAVVQRGAL
jgi:hypothetical protein